MFIIFCIVYFECRLLISCNFFNSHLYSFPSATGTWSARFNASGTRLLCYENDESQLIVYNLPMRHHQATATGKVVLVDVDFRNACVGADACCFLGLEDELVIGGSENNSLFIWSLPDGKRGIDCTINQSFRVLSGHRDTIRCIRSSSDKSAIVSCDDSGVIKLWSSR